MSTVATRLPSGESAAPKTYHEEARQCESTFRRAGSTTAAHLPSCATATVVPCAANATSTASPPPRRSVGLASDLPVAAFHSATRPVPLPPFGRPPGWFRDTSVAADSVASGLHVAQ